MDSIPYAWLACLDLLGNGVRIQRVSVKNLQNRDFLRYLKKVQEGIFQL